MKKKIMALMLVIPIILTFAIFSFSKTAAVLADIPVHDIAIEKGENGFLDIELTSNESHYLKYEVTPLEAKNRDVKITCTPKGLVIDEKTGLISASDVGKYVITVETIDGGFRDSLTVNVTSKKVIDFELGNFLDKNKTPLNKNKIEMGDQFYISTTTRPDLPSIINWESSDSSIIRVDPYTGLCTARKNGTATITATLEDGIHGPIKKSKTIDVFLHETDAHFNLEQSVIWTINNTITMNIVLDKKKIVETGHADILTLDPNEILKIEETSALPYKAEIKLISDNEETVDLALQLSFEQATIYNFNIQLNHSDYNQYQNTLEVHKLTEEEVQFTIQGNPYIMLGATGRFYLDSDVLEDFDGEITWEANSDSVELTTFGKAVDVEGKKADNSVDLTCNVEFFGKNITKTITIEVLEVPTAITIKEGTFEYGTLKEKTYKFGEFKVQGNEYVADSFVPTIMFSGISTDTSDYELTCDREDLVKIEDNKIYVLNSGIVTITATSISAKKLGVTRSDSFTFEVVKDSVNIYSYQDLMKATTDGRYDLILQVTIGSSIDEERLNAKGRTNQFDEFGDEVEEMPTTWDWTYYNNKTGNQPNIKYAVKFSKNLYGNGFTLNAHNLTYRDDATGKITSESIFRGPLNFASFNGAASVKGQDNIVFLVDQDVTINNVILTACNELSDIISSQTQKASPKTVDLNMLNHVGTTVEVMGDNVNIINSRLMNGRTVLRIFGTSNPDDVIHVNVASSVISFGREFLLKMGSNKYVVGDVLVEGSVENDNLAFEQASPNLKIKNQDFIYNVEDKFNGNYENNQDYLDLVKTFVTLKNCVFATSGIFSIGIESHFSGPALDGYGLSGGNYKDQFVSSGWENMAATSYPAQLILEDEVKIYDWKNLNNVDSSTLVEGAGGITIIDFNIADLVKAVAKNDPTLQSIITKIGNDEYVHGGIAFYGGGKNYSSIIRKDFKTEDFKEYFIGFNDIKYEAEDSKLLTFVGKNLPYASGREKFAFLMYSSESSFNYEKQVQDLQSADAYSWIPKA